MALIDYKNRHTGEKCIIFGLGPSLNLIDNVNLDGIVTIGVNNVQQKCNTDYLVVIDPIKAFPDYKKSAVIENTGVLFTNFDEWFKLRKDKVNERIMLGDAGGKNLMKNISNNILNRSCTSPFVATALAIYMGFEHIGIIGVDITAPDHFNVKDGRHILANRLLKIDQHFGELNSYHKLYNMSPESGLKSLEKLPLTSFLEM